MSDLTCKTFLFWGKVNYRSRQHSMKYALSSSLFSFVLFEEAMLYKCSLSDPLHQKGRQNHPVTISITKAQNVSLTAAAQAIRTPQTGRKLCAKYHQPPPFFIGVITIWREVLCGSRCHVTGLWFPLRLLWFTWVASVINIPPWWHTHSWALREDGTIRRGNLWLTEYTVCMGPGCRERSMYPNTYQ